MHTGPHAYGGEQPHSCVFCPQYSCLNGFCLNLQFGAGLCICCRLLSRESWREPQTRSLKIRSFINSRDIVARPVLSTRTSGLRTASRSSLCRRSSSSYSRIVLSNNPNISSAAAVSRWLTKSLIHWILDIVAVFNLLSETPLKCCILVLWCSPG